MESRVILTEISSMAMALLNVLLRFQYREAHDVDRDFHRNLLSILLEFKFALDANGG